MKKIIYALLVGLFVLILAPTNVTADGGLVYDPIYTVSENEQQAVIFHENGTEIMAVTIKFEGNADDFGWILPVPNKPEVDKVSRELFENINIMTTPYDRYYNDSGYSLGVGSDLGFSEGTKQTVTVIEEKTIDYYDVTVLSATNSGDLAVWLNNHDYEIPTDKESYLDEYIEDGWYFVAVKIDNSADNNKVNDDLKNGQVTPLMIAFQSEEIIFPMKISQMSFENEMKVTLYVIADSKKHAGGYFADYANTFSKKEITNLVDTEDSQPWVELGNNEYWVTRLSNTMRFDDNWDDVIIKPFGNTTKVGLGPDQPSLTNKILAWLLVAAYSLGVLIVGAIFIALSPIGFLFILPAFIMSKERSKKTRIACNVMQDFSMVIYFAGLVLSVYFSYVMIENWHTHYWLDTSFELSTEYFDYVIAPILAFVFFAIFLAEIIYKIKIRKKQNRFKREENNLI